MSTVQRPGARELLSRLQLANLAGNWGFGAGDYPCLADAPPWSAPPTLVPTGTLGTYVSFRLRFAHGKDGVRETMLAHAARIDTNRQWLRMWGDDHIRLLPGDHTHGPVRTWLNMGVSPIRSTLAVPDLWAMGDVLPAADEALTWCWLYLDHLKAYSQLGWLIVPGYQLDLYGTNRWEYSIGLRYDARVNAVVGRPYTRSDIVGDVADGKNLYWVWVER